MQLDFLTKYGKMVLHETTDTAEFLRNKLLKINRQLRALAKDSKYAKQIKCLRSIPGIGLIVAITLLSELDTITRFRNLDGLCSYVGLIPSTFSSG